MMKAPAISCIALAALLPWHALGAQVDSSFNPDFPGPVNALALAPDGSIIVAGYSGAARLNADGAVLATFPTDAPVNAVVALENEAVWGGRFSRFDDAAAHNLAATDRQLPGTSGSVDALAVDSAGRLVLGGNFTAVGGGPAVYTARLTASGEVDDTFNAALRRSWAIEAGVTALAVQPDGKILVGGIFETERGFECLARLAENGALDQSFALADKTILYTKAILPLASGKLLVAGQSKNGKGFVKRLNGDGSVDVTFAAEEFAAPVHALALAGEQRVLAGGRGLSCLQMDGSFDPAWTFESGAVIHSVVVDPGGRILIGGSAGVRRLLDTSGLNPFATNGRTFRASLRVAPGQMHLIEASTDLETWTAVGYGTSDSNSLEVVDDNPGAHARRFFRARAQ